MSYEQLTNKFEEDVIKTLRLLIKIFTLHYNEKELRQNSEKSFILHKNINYVMPILKKHGFDFIDFDYSNQTSKLKYISRHGYGLLSVTDMANATAIGVTLGISFNSKPYKFTADEIKQILRNKTNEDIINFFKKQKFDYAIDGNPGMFFYNIKENLLCYVDDNKVYVYSFKYPMKLDSYNEIEGW